MEQELMCVFVEQLNEFFEDLNDDAKFLKEDLIGRHILFNTHLNGITDNPPSFIKIYVAIGIVLNEHLKELSSKTIWEKLLEILEVFIKYEYKGEITSDLLFECSHLGEFNKYEICYDYQINGLFLREH